MSAAQLVIDGIAIDQVVCRFKGTTDVTVPDSLVLAKDAQLMIVIRGRVSGLYIDALRNGDTRRTNVFTAAEMAVIRDPALETELVETLGFDQDQDPPVAVISAVVIAATGEVVVPPPEDLARIIQEAENPDMWDDDPAPTQTRDTTPAQSETANGNGNPVEVFVPSAAGGRIVGRVQTEDQRLRTFLESGQ